ncbi:MAG TPA: prepilin-type N-terminal cleavage/methylation domain-containing protein [Terriglobales bacterium]|jgi:prepilin-type N-terminal cleavage/methylation domain-containing protein|nr:prepilin-type N-terminal cleavage/methylation domain-containing protein [Terriglobales bacterium]
MRRSDKTRRRGFSLAELLVAMAMGLVVLAAAVNLFSMALSASFLVTQRAEMQQDGRAALDMMAKDISLAGAGIVSGGVQLPDGGGATASLFGCDQNTCYVNNNDYPINNHFYGVIPNPGVGLSVMTAGGVLSPPTDVLTIAYTDTTFPLNDYSVALNASGSQATFTVLNPAPNPLPVPWPPPAINDPAVGLKAGDLILFSNSVGQAIGEVTRVNAGGVVDFANGDPLNINQSTAADGNIQALWGGLAPPAAPPPIIATRLQVITYYIDVPVGQDGNRYTADDGPPRLMRQVNGQSPAPVAENVAGLQVSYDIYDDVSGVATANLKDAGMSAGKSPNQIRKVNLSVMTRSPMPGGKRGFQTLNLATSVSARDMSFKDRYK